MSTAGSGWEGIDGKTVYIKIHREKETDVSERHPDGRKKKDSCAVVALLMIGGLGAAVYGIVTGVSQLFS